MAVLGRGRDDGELDVMPRRAKRGRGRGDMRYAPARLRMAKRLFVRIDDRDPIEPGMVLEHLGMRRIAEVPRHDFVFGITARHPPEPDDSRRQLLDRKSTRLNSSHG